MVYKRASQNIMTKYFFSLPTSSVSRPLTTPTAKVKRDEFLASDLKQGDIVAALWQCLDEGGVDKYFLGEVSKVAHLERRFSVTSLSDGALFDYSWDDEEMTKILKVNDVKFGDLFKACGRHIVGRPLLFRDIVDDNRDDNRF